MHARTRTPARTPALKDGCSMIAASRCLEAKEAAGAVADGWVTVGGRGVACKREGASKREAADGVREARQRRSASPSVPAPRAASLAVWGDWRRYDRVPASLGRAAPSQHAAFAPSDPSPPTTNRTDSAHRPSVSPTLQSCFRRRSTDLPLITHPLRSRRDRQTPRRKKRGCNRAGR